MTIPLFQVDAFTDRPFHGNPAAVCLLEAARDEEWMQSVAAEMNLAETAFVSPREDGYDLRWFTPTCEVDLCGHATLATAHALWETKRLPAGVTARFHTKSGWLTASQRDGLIELDFPATPPDPAPAFAASLAAAVRAPVEWAGRSRFDLVARLANADTVRRATPDLALVAALPCRGVIITAPGDDGVARLRLPLLRTTIGRGRRPGHRLGALRPGALLGRGARPHHAGGIPGIAPWRHGARPAGR